MAKSFLDNLYNDFSRPLKDTGKSFIPKNILIFSAKLKCFEIVKTFEFYKQDSFGDFGQTLPPMKAVSNLILMQWHQSPFKLVNAEMSILRLWQGCPTASSGPHAASEVVSSGPLCNKFVSRLFIFLVFFIGSSIFATKTHQNYTCYSVVGLPTKHLYNKRFVNISIF